MKTKELHHFLERGYLQFPYIIVRYFPTVYRQVPIHRRELKKHFSEGIFLHPDQEQLQGYEGACHTLFEDFYVEQTASKIPMDMCLVFNEYKARFLSKTSDQTQSDSKHTFGPVPWGGILMSCDGDIMRFNQPHFIM